MHYFDELKKGSKKKTRAEREKNQESRARLSIYGVRKKSKIKKSNIKLKNEKL